MGTSKMNHKLCMCAASEMSGVWIKLHCIFFFGCLSETYCCLSIWDGFSGHMMTSLTPSFLQVTFPCVISSCLCLPYSATFMCPFIWKASVCHTLGSSASFLTLGKAGSWVSFYLEAIRTAKICLDSLHLPAHPPLPNPSHRNTTEKTELTSLYPF